MNKELDLFLQKQDNYPLDEARLLHTQKHCQNELEALLDTLRGLVSVARMPPPVRAHLMKGLNHLEAHIVDETADLVMMIRDRRN